MFCNFALSRATQARAKMQLRTYRQMKQFETKWLAAFCAQLFTSGCFLSSLLPELKVDWKFKFNIFFKLSSFFCLNRYRVLYDEGRTSANFVPDFRHLFGATKILPRVAAGRRDL